MDGPAQQDAGVEMQDDFEGALEDVPEQPEDPDSPQDAEEDRLDQAMGDVGEQASGAAAAGKHAVRCSGSSEGWGGHYA